MEEYPRVVAEKPSIIFFIIGIMLVIFSMVPLPGATLGGRIIVVLLGLGLISLFVKQNKNYNNIKNILDYVEYWNPEEPEITLTRPLSYETGWLVLEAIPGSPYKGSTRFISHGGKGNSRIIRLPGEYLLVYNYNKDFIAVLPAARIHDSCCKDIVVVLPPTRILGQKTINIRACDAPNCPRARIKLENGRLVIEAENPTRDRYAVTLCIRPRRWTVNKKCVDLAHLEPNKRTVREIGVVPAGRLLVTYTGVEPQRILERLYGGKIPPVSGYVLNTPEAEIFIRKLVFNLL